MHTHNQWTTYVLLAAIAGIITLKFIYPNARQTYIPGPEIMTDSLDAISQLPDTLPQKEYNARLQRLTIEDWCEKGKLTDHGKGKYAGFGGYTLIHETDNCKHPGKNEIDKHFLVLTGYKLRLPTQFYIRNGKYYLKKEVRTMGKDGKPADHYGYEEINIRYAGNQLNYYDEGMVLVPVTEKKYNKIKFITRASIIFYQAVAIFLVVLLIRILFFIAKRRSFRRSNSRDLSIIGWGVILLVLLPNLAAIVFYRMYGDNIPAEIYLPWQITLLRNSWWLVAGLVILLLANVFRKGHYIRSLAI